MLRRAGKSAGEFREPAFISHECRNHKSRGQPSGRRELRQREEEVLSAESLDSFSEEVQTQSSDCRRARAGRFTEDKENDFLEDERSQQCH